MRYCLPSFAHSTDQTGGNKIVYLYILNCLSSRWILRSNYTHQVLVQFRAPSTVPVLLTWLPVTVLYLCLDDDYQFAYLYSTLLYGVQYSGQRTISSIQDSIPKTYVFVRILSTSCFLPIYLSARLARVSSYCVQTYFKKESECLQRNQGEFQSQLQQVTALQ